MNDADTLDLARRFLDDMDAQVRENPTFPLLLDQAVARMEFARALGEDHRAEDAFHEAMGLLRSGGGTGPWLYRGAAQAGWTALRLARERGTEPSGLGAVDDAVLRWIADYPAEGEVDLPMGVLGLGAYALAHPDAGFRDKATSGVLDVVEERAERDGDGLFLRLGDSPARRADQSAGCRVLGAAHGTAGLVSYLASAAGTAAAPRARPLLDDSVRWLRAQRGDFSHAVFPHRVETRYTPARATWCSGDPGIALALTAAAGVTGDPRDADLARATASAVATRPERDCGITDGCVCHGAAGLVWFGRRAHDDHGLPEGLECVRRWTGWLAERRAEGPLTYFNPAGMIRDASFLEGDAGVALALLYAATGARPAWEQLVLARPVTPEV
ncbi:MULTISPECIES: lanthionine synthetase C family protein [Nocardiopsis]|uniref:Lanthionine synthetase C family protein n=1 Tax=Nocardiopsis dassonvillei (strain ATCC 23218 / DSM 43111 / CIP 107115 / JCM 7437 / KCTC 9190 / NBRC 14626 / NCTC 10488 / NRRL B-5397 / IMRU 509) TaxID=446468 RepID=D7AZ99_NOCDD|nr:MULTISPECIES: lanthionine synthetase C family protein [Nocardiopsis]ADH70079.1 Lanthionine synthetase C family protein [Nocardiopsis dassonvillei subsp. dassonvillei DSM 43111]APC38058.1 lanthionine synthetase [Nocardiopsis dassonvillei]NKY80592.1 lanthionine synthetase C family protein [Nocardiopsis dassonvillei]VEI90594.1 Lantibiotic modifying enzyme [Nocardiopsis dassonvillei]